MVELVDDFRTLVTLEQQRLGVQSGGIANRMDEIKNYPYRFTPRVRERNFHPSLKKIVCGRVATTRPDRGRERMFGRHCRMWRRRFERTRSRGSAGIARVRLLNLASLERCVSAALVINVTGSLDPSTGSGVPGPEYRVLGNRKGRPASPIRLPPAGSASVGGFGREPDARPQIASQYCYNGDDDARELIIIIFHRTRVPGRVSALCGPFRHRKEVAPSTR